MKNWRCSFNSSLVYDPDLSVVLNTNTGGSNDLQLQALISLAVIPLGFVLLAALVVVIWILARRRVNQKHSINYAPESTDEDGL